jgi:elongation factor 1-beta
MREFINYGAPLAAEVEIRATALFSAVCLKADPAVLAGGRAASGSVSSAGGKGPASPKAGASPKKAAAPAKAEVADDLDLFGDDDEEEAEALKKLNEKMEAEKKANKAGKGKGERSLIVLEVKPFDAETDLQAVAKGIKMIEHEGIQNWGKEHKLMPIAFGVCKLAISAVVYDDLMDIEGLSELINAKYENDVQSIDCQAMSKV